MVAYVADAGLKMDSHDKPKQERNLIRTPRGIRQKTPNRNLKIPRRLGRENQEIPLHNQRELRFHQKAQSST